MEDPSTQYALDFTSGQAERLALIRSLERVADLVVDSDGRRLSYGRLCTVIEILERISLLARDGVVGEISLMWLGSRVTQRRSVSERTIRRWVADAKAVGLLETWERSHDFGGPNWNRFTIRMDRIRQLVAGARRLSHEVSWGADTAGHGRTRPDKMSALGGQSVRPKKRQEKEEEIIPPPPPTEIQPLRAPSATHAAEWGVVVEEISARGVADASKAVASARANGCTPGHIRAVLRAYQGLLEAHPGAYGPGALKWRIQNARPSQDAAAAWPPPRPPVEAARAHTERQWDRIALQALQRRIVIEGRRQQLPDDAIRARMREKLPAEFLASEPW